MRLLVSIVVLFGSLFCNAAFANDQCSNGASGSILTVQDWSIKKGTDSIGWPIYHMTETVQFGGSNPIRMIDGSILFGDILGGQIGSMAIDRDTHLKPGETVTLKNDWGPNTFERLLKMNRKDVTALACVDSVVYDNGEIKEFSK